MNPKLSRDSREGPLDHPVLEKARADEEAWDEASRARLWREIATRANRSPSRKRLLIPVFATALVAAVVLLRPQTPPPPPASEPDAWRQIELAGIAHLEVQPGASFNLGEAAREARERRVYLFSGQLRARVEKQSSEHPFVVATPQARVVVVGTRFCVEVTAERTELLVEEGLVRLEAVSGRVLMVAAGERVATDDPRLRRVETPPLAPPTPATVPGPSSASKRNCRVQASLAAQRACWEQVAEEGGIAGEGALYTLGQLAQREGRAQEALEQWQRHAQRYPRGILAPEVALARVQVLQGERRHAEALAEVESFLERFGSHGRTDEVRLVRAQLLCERFGRPEEALRTYDETLESGSRALAEEALFSKGACADAVGKESEAKTLWMQYLERYPTGAHASEIRQLLSD